MTAITSTLLGRQADWWPYTEGENPSVVTKGGSMKGLFDKSGDWWEGFGAGLLCALIALISGKLWRGESTVGELISGVSWGILIFGGFFIGLYLINKPRLDREAAERQQIAKKYERWVRGEYTVEELQDIKTEE